MSKLTDKGYAGYLRALDAKIERLEEKGYGDEYIPSKLTRREWEYQYEATRNDLKQLVSEGKRKVVGNVNQYIIRDQVYEFSIEQARNFRRAAKKMLDDEQITADEVPSIEKIMLGAEDINWDIISEAYHDAKAQGMPGKQAGKYIAHYFFGSP